MVTPAVVRAFRSIGWGWGGDWSRGTKDWMHFSATVARPTTPRARLQARWNGYHRAGFGDQGRLSAGSITAGERVAFAV
jgi:hypothetical protein